MHAFRLAVFGLWLTILSGLALAADPVFPQLTGPVVDAAGIMAGGEKQALEERLRAYEISSGKQVVVATVPSLEGYDIRDYGNRLFRSWQLGDKKRDDGVLLLIAPSERKVSIETGYGTEGDLTDAMSRIIIENAIIPRFKAGDWSGGASAGVDDIIKTLGGQGTVVADRARNHNASPTIEDLIPLIFLFIFVVFIIASVSRGGGRRSRVIILPMPGGYSGGWGGGGGGWSGGGGYSGGGGSSGGGGASGSW